MLAPDSGTLFGRQGAVDFQERLDLRFELLIGTCVFRKKAQTELPCDVPRVFGKRPFLLGAYEDEMNHLDSDQGERSQRADQSDQLLGEILCVQLTQIVDQSTDMISNKTHRLEPFRAES